MDQSRRKRTGKDKRAAAAAAAQQAIKKKREATTTAAAAKARPDLEQEEEHPEDPDMRSLEFEDVAGEDLEEVVVDEEAESIDPNAPAAADTTMTDGENKPKTKVFRVGIDSLQEGETLEAAPGAYKMLHRCQTEWPCLSFDTLADSLGASRTNFPLTAYVVAGTQADAASKNKLVVMKWSRLHKTSKDRAADDDDEDASSSDDDSDDGNDEDAAMDFRFIKHKGGINRIRAMPQSIVAGGVTQSASQLVATWADFTAHVNIYDIGQELMALDGNRASQPNMNAKPLFTHMGHNVEGFGMAWNPHQSKTGEFVSGDCNGHLFFWQPRQGGWSCAEVRQEKYGSHQSIEDLQFKKTGNDAENIFAAASVDGSVKIWDTRTLGQGPVSRIGHAHSTDVNVLSWNPQVADLLLTGADDGSFKVWDLRYVEAGAMAHFAWHKGPITSVDWHPCDETVIAVASADDSVSFWDMSVEEDPQAQDQMLEGAEHYPAQLLFLHQGQDSVKEVKWHPQLPGVLVSTAADGFNIMKTCNID